MADFFPGFEQRRVKTSGAEIDRAGRGRKVAMPLLALWGTRSGQGAGYDVLAVWRDHAEDVRGHAIESGHFIPEENPDAAFAALRTFLRRVDGQRSSNAVELPCVLRGFAARSTSG